MLPGTYFGTPFKVTATGTVVLTSANAAIVGILFWGTATGILNVFAGTTSTVGTNGAFLGRVVAYPTVAGATINQASYIPFPAYCSGGITVQNAGTTNGSLDPAITLFWNPTGGA